MAFGNEYPGFATSPALHSPNTSSLILSWYSFCLKMPFKLSTSCSLHPYYDASAKRDSAHRTNATPPKAARNRNVLTSLESLEGSLKEPDSKEFQCERCPRIFTRRENLARHANSRTSSPPGNCSRPNCTYSIFDCRYKLTFT